MPTRPTTPGAAPAWTIARGHQLGADGAAQGEVAVRICLAQPRGVDRVELLQAVVAHVVEKIDLGARRLGYFHNAGYFELHGEDFGQIFALDVAPPLRAPYAEIGISSACSASSCRSRASSGSA